MNAHDFALTFDAFWGGALFGFLACLLMLLILAWKMQ